MQLMPGIVHCRSLKMLGVVIADDISVTQHVVRRLVTSSAQTTYGVRASSVALSRSEQRGSAARLSSHRRCSPQFIERRQAGPAGTLPAWRGFTKASDRQRINFINHAQ